MKSSDNLAKVLFVLSLVFFAFLYGIITGYKNWPPTRFLDRALGQARRIYRSLPIINPPSIRVYNQVYNRSGVNIKQPQKIQPGMTLITSLWDWNNSGDLEAGAKLINQNGQTLHSWQLNTSKLFPESKNHLGKLPQEIDYHGTYLFPNGDLLLNLEYVGTMRVNSCGELIWRLPEYTHHSISRAEDGTFWIPAIYGEKRSGSKQYPKGFPGLSGKKIWVERILHINENGKILKDINVIDLIFENDLKHYIPKYLRWVSSPPDEIAHINDVEPLSSSMADQYPLFEAGDLLVSLRRLNLVFVFDPVTLNVKWHTTKALVLQHDPDFIGDGWIGVFDNNTDPTKRGTMLGGSRIVAIKPSTKEVEIKFPTSNSDPFYTFHRGKWQMLENGNMLLTEAAAGRIVEVAPDGSTVWEWIHKPFGKSKVPKVTKGTRYDLTKEQVASWPCSSVSSSENTQQEGG